MVCLRAMRCVRARAIAAVAAVFAAELSGCATPPRADEPGAASLRVVRQAGGLNRNLAVVDGTWYQTRGDELLVLDAADGREITRVRFGEPGRAGQATDVLADGDRLHIVLLDDAVVSLDITSPQAPAVVRVIEARSLDILPRTLSRVGDDIYASGDGGVVRLSDGRRMYAAAGEAGPVVEAHGTLVTALGRRVYRMDDASYLGSASTLHPLPDDLPRSPGAMFAFTRRGDDATGLGLMTADIREVNANTATVRLEGEVHAVAFGEGLVWAAMDDGVRAWRIDGDALIETQRFDMTGARDLAIADGNRLAVCGEFGRGIVRIADDGRNPGGMMIHEVEAPGRIVAAQADGRSILAFDGRRHWLYDTWTNELRIERGVSVVVTGDGGPDDHAATLAGSARIDEDGRGMTITTRQEQLSHTEPQRPRMHCIVAVAGRYWVGHDRGITVLDPGKSGAPVVDRLRLPGAVIFLMPLPDGTGAAFVTEAGVFGVVESTGLSRSSPK